MSNNAMSPSAHEHSLSTANVQTAGSTHEIKCPSCGQQFSIDEAGYAQIVDQVRNEEFQRDLAERLALAAKEKEAALEVATAKAAQEAETERAKLDARILELQGELRNASAQKKLEVELAKAESDRERGRLKAELARAKDQLETAMRTQHLQADRELTEGRGEGRGDRRTRGSAEGRRDREDSRGPVRRRDGREGARRAEALTRVEVDRDGAALEEPGRAVRGGDQGPRGCREAKAATVRPKALAR
ncbi:hypothetical protein [Cellulosimicrobium composti]|uniref:DUF2130 domain-containing protein n=1 Tax=Cellulosimicrobium composti TaxID=2672572 RepID=A0ABX0B899_9MICO|nr:hypothetical protein [Cellulosimicrobium composti]NDO88501.1 hypothetical protein [Cellulosimicrobium composti]